MATIGTEFGAGLTSFGVPVVVKRRGFFLFLAGFFAVYSFAFRRILSSPVEGTLGATSGGIVRCVRGAPRSGGLCWESASFFLGDDLLQETL